MGLITCLLLLTIEIGSSQTCEYLNNVGRGSAAMDNTSQSIKGKYGPVVVILNSSLVNGEIHQKLEANPWYRVRVSQGTERNSIIFPGKSLAFMVVAITEIADNWPPVAAKCLNEEIVERIQKFSNIHRNCHLLLLARMTTKIEYTVLGEIQRRFWASSLMIYPLSGAKQCIHVLEQASLSKKDACGTKEGYDGGTGRLHEEMAQKILEKNLGITNHQSLVLLDGCQNIANVACNTAENLMEMSPLPRDVAKKVEKFFEKDCVSF